MILYVFTQEMIYVSMNSRTIFMKSQVKKMSRCSAWETYIRSSNLQKEMLSWS